MAVRQLSFPTNSKASPLGECSQSAGQVQRFPGPQGTATSVSKSIELPVENEIMPTSRRFFLIAFCLFTPGCGKQGIAPESIADSQEAFDAGRDKVDSGDYSGALALLSRAVDAPGLDPDQLCSALLYRSICFSQTGDLNRAASDIEEAEMGGPSEALLIYAKAIMLENKGEYAAATKLFSAARRLDASLKKPSR